MNPKKITTAQIEEEDRRDRQSLDAHRKALMEAAVREAGPNGMVIKASTSAGVALTPTDTFMLYCPDGSVFSVYWMSHEKSVRIRAETLNGSMAAAVSIMPEVSNAFLFNAVKES